MKEGEERDESCKDEQHEKREVWQDGVPQDRARDEEPPPRHTTGPHVPPRPRNEVEYKQVPPKGCVLLPNTSYFECLPHPQAQGFSASVNNSRGKTGLKSPTWHLLRLTDPPPPLLTQELKLNIARFRHAHIWKLNAKSSNSRWRRLGRDPALEGEGEAVTSRHILSSAGRGERMAIPRSDAAAASPLLSAEGR